jgi:hypothetical protein
MCGCGSGGKNTVSIKNNTTNSPSNLDEDLNSLVLVEYTGTNTNKMGLRSRTRPRDRYMYSKEENTFFAYKADIGWLESLGDFTIIKEALTGESIVNDFLPLESHTIAPDFSEIPIDILPIDPIILANLKKNGYDKLERVRLASDGELLALKGMGDKRLKDLRKALNSV